ncbi:MAG: peptide-methionine (S)-S-oxide reductase MsrA [Kiloniellales bacterium]
MFETLTGPLKIDPGDFPDPEQDLTPAESLAAGETEAVATIAGGCFWCTEAVYVELDGVLGVRSGYSGGAAETADYRSVCSGTTGHAEAIEIRYDPKRLSYGQILKLFFSIAHDPTQLNGQGADLGTQYRSAIFTGSEAQKRVAEAYIAQLEKAGAFRGRIVTTLEPLGAFHPAEDYHQRYAARNPSQPYIAAIAMPKVKKLRKHFGSKLKRAG